MIKNHLYRLIFQDIYITFASLENLHSKNPSMNERKKKITFIVNPISGTQSKEQILNLLDEKMDKAKICL